MKTNGRRRVLFEVIDENAEVFVGLGGVVGHEELVDLHHRLNDRTRRASRRRLYVKIKMISLI